MLQGKKLLTPLQHRCLDTFVRLPDQDHFYLAGGTALAEFFFGHRLSFDLDFFTSEERLILPFSYSFEQIYTHEGWRVSVTRRFASFVEFLLTRETEEESLRVELALDAPFKLEPAILSAYGIWVNAYRDLIVEKLLTYYGRAEPRDAVDLYFILQRESLEELLTLAAQKDPGFDLYWFAVALNKAGEFPDELNQWPVKMLVEFNPLLLKRSFQTIALQIMTRIFPR